MIEFGATKSVSPQFDAVVGQEELKEALLVVTVDPELGGLLVRGEKGTAKSTAVRGLVDLLGDQRAVADCPYGCPPVASEGGCLQCSDCRVREDPPVEIREVPLVTLPLGATRERVVGSLSVADALDGESSFDPGLLARANRGILYVDEINLLEDHLVDVLLDAAASGVNRVERDGVSVEHPARFTLVGTMNPEEGDLRPQLRDRFALQVTVEGCRDIEDRVAIIDRALSGTGERNRTGSPTSNGEVTGDGAANGDEDGARPDARGDIPVTGYRERLDTARELLPEVALRADTKRDIAELCRDAGVDGHRADIATARAARALAALDGRPTVVEGDVRRAAELALPHRLQSRPFEDAPDAAEVIDDHFEADGEGGGEGADGEGEGEGADGESEAERGGDGGSEADAGSRADAGSEADVGSEADAGTNSQRYSGARSSEGSVDDSGAGPDGSGTGGRANETSGDEPDTDVGGRDGIDQNGDGKAGVTAMGQPSGGSVDGPDEGTDHVGNDGAGDGATDGAGDGATDGADDGAGDAPVERAEEESGVPLLPGQDRDALGGATPPDVGAADPGTNTDSVGGGSRAETIPAPDNEGVRVRTEPADASATGIDAAASVRAAARRSAGAGSSCDVRERDLRRSVRTGSCGALVVFALDASASMRPAMRHAKAVVLELLRDAYEQRDAVAVVTFAGEGADVVLPPTDSVDLAARHLKDLHTDDRTPLPSGLRTAGEVLTRADPDAAAVVLVTDGRANADADPTRATRRAARALGELDPTVVVVDVGDGRGLVHEVVRHTDGERVPLEALTPERVDAAVGRGGTGPG